MEKLKAMIFTVYRPPNCEYVHFENTLERLLTNLAEFKIFLCGNFHFPFIRLLNNHESVAPGSYIIGRGNAATVTNQAKTIRFSR